MNPHHNNKSLSQDRFGRFSERYVASHTHAKGADLDRLLFIAQPQTDWIVLDIATGGGHTALKIAPHVARMIASDLTPQMLASAEKHLPEQGISNVEFRQADAEDLPFEDLQFDLVTCRIAPHHFPECAKFVLEAARVLKPGGILVLQDHVLPEDQSTARYIDAFEKLRDPSHHRAYSRSEWFGFFEQAGLTVERTEEIEKHHQFFQWAAIQDCSPATIEMLEALIKLAPASVLEWMDPQEFGSQQATFTSHHLLIRGRKTLD